MAFILYSEFKRVLSLVPLISNNLCLYFEGQILLGHRKNKQAKNSWFTPSGRIIKNQSWQVALCSIAITKLIVI